MISSMRLALALAAAGLAAPAAANDGAPPVLANTELDVLTASTVLTAGGLAGAAPADTALAADATGFVENATARFSAWLWTPTRLAEARLAQDGLGGNGLTTGSLTLPAGSPATAAGAGATASAAASVTGASVSRSVGTRSPDTTAAASASAAGPGLSSVSVTAHSAPGFSGAFSRSTSLSAR